MDEITPCSDRAVTAPVRTLLVGCGRLGTRLGRRLIARGADVLAVRRDISSLPARFPALSVDLQDSEPPELPDTDAMVVTLPPGTRGDSQPAGDYLDLLRHLAGALSRVPPRVLFVSSTGIFEGWTGSRALTEDDAPAPGSARGRLLRDAELLASDLFGAKIIRPAGIYGPGREMLVRKVLERTPVQYAKRTNRIHETDLVRTLETMLTMDHPPDLVHAVDQQPATLGEITTFIARELGLPPPPRIQPEVTDGKILDGALLLRTLTTLQYPTFETGYRHLIATRRE